jgi:hypothetical protein
MVMNRLQKGLINSRIALRPSRLNCQKKCFKWEHIIFFSNSKSQKIKLFDLEKKIQREWTLVISKLPLLGSLSVILFSPTEFNRWWLFDFGMALWHDLSMGYNSTDTTVFYIT